jgi:hypothetical protein
MLTSQLHLKDYCCICRMDANPPQSPPWLTEIIYAHQVAMTREQQATLAGLRDNVPAINVV